MKIFNSILELISNPTIEFNMWFAGVLVIALMITVGSLLHEKRKSNN